jgi:cytochrome c-type biogenesis protein CcmE
MKTIHIVILLVLVIAVAVVVTTLTDSSTYSDFSVAAATPGKEFHIIGTLDKAKSIDYDATKNVSRFSFYLIDDKGLEKKVVYNNPKPQDFEKSEKVVIIGSMKNDEFFASSLLLKCPSKYNANKPEKFGTKTYKAK